MKTQTLIILIAVAACLGCHGSISESRQADSGSAQTRDPIARTQERVHQHHSPRLDVEKQQSIHADARPHPRDEVERLRLIREASREIAQLQESVARVRHEAKVKAEIDLLRMTDEELSALVDYKPRYREFYKANQKQFQQTTAEMTLDEAREEIRTTTRVRTTQEFAEFQRLKQELAD